MSDQQADPPATQATAEPGAAAAKEGGAPAPDRPASSAVDSSSRSKSRRDRSRSRDRDRRRSRSRDRRRSRSRDRHRSRSRRDRSRSRDRRRRSRSRDRDRDRDRRRRRSRSRDRRSRRRSRSRDRSRDRRDRGRSRRHDREHESATHVRSESPAANHANLTPEERAARAQADELQELTRDQRTVFVAQLKIKVTARQIKDFFEQVGKVRDVVLVTDRQTRRSKGHGYVEMRDVEAVPAALALHGVTPDFQKYPIAVKASEAEKNFTHRQEAAAAQRGGIAGPLGGGGGGGGGAPPVVPSAPPVPCRLHVSNVPPMLTGDDLRGLFEPYGQVESVEVLPDRGAAYVRYRFGEDARRAETEVDGMAIAQYSLKVRAAPEGPSAGGGGGGASWRLDEDSSAGLAFNPESRQQLMQRLAGGRTEMPEVPGLAAPAAPPAAPAAATDSKPDGRPSVSLTLSNMFDPAQEAAQQGPSWAQELTSDVAGECSRFGELRHVHVDTRDPRGVVWLMFRTVTAASQCAEAMHGRLFSGHKIAVAFVPAEKYAELHPSSVA